MPLQALNFKEIPPEAGVYQIRWAINGRPQPIHRANGTDEGGLLYIGETKNLKSRIRSSRGMSHTAGRTYIIYDYGRKFKPNQLEVKWAVIPKEESEKVESKILDDYVRGTWTSHRLTFSLEDGKHIS